ncbi:hypothetical protein CPC08DRAFT_504290 [Agrocybe pediades]|nr:hypothetical protein CPC08DRAFT_504290 [Agrocybe pediades]
MLYAITIQSHPVGKLEELSLGITTPSTRSLLSWMPTLPKHIDSLLTRAYSALNKLCLSKLKTTPSPESIFKLRTYALRCLVHTSAGTIEANNFCNQATRSLALRQEHPCERRRTDDEHDTSCIPRARQPCGIAVGQGIIHDSLHSMKRAMVL